ncbi:sperm flagellar protein 1 isoform X2 [Salvelinus sp. IW2-2015]|uniref:sperm flagellar protein 1 isoform X2 n=1 Tax=Salvelinus sp. IW2-2015 TaxID=2691554 RepID=UPI000CEA8F23|nr:sperm flagellar protein 1 isoform X2 [Salvelinus alpinus]
MDKELNEEILQDLFAWIDKIPLSRPKRNITRDFSDGVMAAEVVKYFFPKLVELHNYTPANSIQQKLSNWGTLNRKVFSKLNLIPEETVKRIVDVEYYNNRNQEKPLTEPPPNDAQKKPGLGKKEERAHVHQHTDKTSTVLGSQVDPTIRLVLEEKEQALLALQETVEILQIKVNRLEHLVQLKDMRLEDLTRHLERYKARSNVP